MGMAGIVKICYERSVGSSNFMHGRLSEWVDPEGGWEGGPDSRGGHYLGCPKRARKVLTTAKSALVEIISRGDRPRFQTQ